MYESNVLGVMRMTRTLLPKLIASGDGHVVTVGSTAGIESYPGGAGYNAAKHGVRAVMDVFKFYQQHFRYQGKFPVFERML